MTIQDLRGSWPCALCDSEGVDKRGTVCPTCELKLTHSRGTTADAAGPQLRLLADDEPASFVRPWQDVTPKGEYL